MQLKKIIFMLSKFIYDLTRPQKTYLISDDVHANKLGEYYFIFKEERIMQGKDQRLIKKFDQDGIPLNKTYIDVKEKDYVYFPISIGQLGLAVYHTYLASRDQSDKLRFMKFVDWFYKNGEIDDRLGVRWFTHVPLPQYKNPGPWQSAFAQSRAISILLRGYQLTDDEKYKTMAEKALIPFYFSVPEGGVSSFTKFGPFYEEYTAAFPTLVLNGMIFSLFGIYDFIRVFPENKLAKKIFEQGIDTLKNILPEYDLGYWSRYNLCQASWYPKIDPATKTYQYLHVIQLEVLYRLTGKELFKEYVDLFKNQINRNNLIRMYLTKFKALRQLKRL
jgi:hypothetical protein